MDEPQPPSQQPPSMGLAVRLMWLGAALTVVGLFLGLVQRDEIRDFVADENPTFSEERIDEETDALTTRNVVGAIIGVALWFWMAAMNGRGRPWARIVATVLGAINILLSLIPLAAGLLTPLGVVMTVIGLALAVTILVLLYKPESSRYYDVMSGRVGY